VAAKKMQQHASKQFGSLEKILSEIAIEYLTPPPTSVDVERLFSIAGQIVSDKRNKLNPINAEKILFLRENLCRVNYQY